MTDETKEIKIADKTFILHKVPVVKARKISILYAPNDNGVISAGDSQEGMLQLLQYVSVRLDGNKEGALVTEDLINNHVPNVAALMQLESAMLEYNFSF